MTENSFYWAGTSTGDAGPYAANTMWKVLAQIAGAGNAESISDVYNAGVFYAVDNKLEVTLDGVNLDVDTGAALVDGAYYENDTAVDITVDAAAAGDERIDYIVLRKCYSGSTYDPGGNVPAVGEQEVRITVIKGTEVTPPTSPSTPSLTQDTSRATYWDVPLATVEVDDTGATSVTDAREYTEIFVYRTFRSGLDSRFNSLADEELTSNAMIQTGVQDIVSPADEVSIETVNFVKEFSVVPMVFANVIPSSDYAASDTITATVDDVTTSSVDIRVRFFLAGGYNSVSSSAISTLQWVAIGPM